MSSTRSLRRVLSTLRRRARPQRPAKVRLDAGAMAERWDKEWIAYFRRAPDYFIDFSTPNNDSRRRVEQVRAALDRRSDSPASPVDDSNPVWSFWAIGCLPDEIADRDVLDVGCGAGGIGRTIGYVAGTYVGIDYSPLALRVAQLVSPPHCRYVVRTDDAAIAALDNSVDTAFCRSVYIHQNFQQAVDLTSLVGRTLRRGGVLAADFYRPAVDERGTPLKPLLPAKRPLEHEPTRSYYFTDDEIAEVGTAADLTLETIIDAPERNWRIARYRK